MANSIQLLYPYYRTIINKLKFQSSNTHFARSIVLLILTLLSSLAFYFGTKKLLSEVRELQEFIYLPADRLLALFLLFLFVTITISNIAIAIGKFYQSSDLELLLSAPVNFWNIFVAKFLQTCWSASWMPLIIMAPVLLAFFKDAGQLTLINSLTTILILIPYFILPTGLAVMIATIFLIAGFKNYSKILVIIAITLIAWLGWGLLSAISEHSSIISSSKGLVKAMSVLALAHVDWLPSNWTGRSFSYLLEGKPVIYSIDYRLLFSSALIATSFSYLMLLFFFDLALAKEKSSQALKSSRAVIANILGTLITRPKIRALAIKEYSQLLRETSQFIQVILLFVLSGLYLYHLETLALASQFSVRFELAWTAFLSITTLAVGCFFILAFTTRVVFPSISLEGRAFWYLVAKPISIKEFLLAKLWIWFIPIAVLSAVFFTLGARAIHLHSNLIPLIAVFGVMSAYGAVGTAIGLGAKFSNFDWEYSSQLIASFGSILYMLSTTLLLTIGCIPLAVIISVFYKPANFSQLGLETQIVYIVLAGIALWLPHVVAARYAMKAGERELRDIVLA